MHTFAPAQRQLRPAEPLRRPVPPPSTSPLGTMHRLLDAVPKSGSQVASRLHPSNVQASSGSSRPRRFAHDFSRISVHAGERPQTASTVTEHPDGVVTETQGIGPAPAPTVGPTPAGCYVERASFNTIPSGTIPATLSGRKLGAAFSMIGDFVPRTPCTPYCGEYRQYVRGTFTANGAKHVHSLGGGRNLHPTTFQEDGDVAAGTVYGHRSVPGTKSKFTPNQANGWRFEGQDEPGIAGPSGTALAMNLDFTGDLIDTCRANQVLATSSWTVAGSATVP